MNYQCPNCRKIVPLKPEHMPFNCACGVRYETLGGMRQTDRKPRRQKFRTKRPKAKASREERLLRRLPDADRIKDEAKARGMLVGDVIAAMTTAIGIPPCGGCKVTQAWLNKADLWFRGWLAAS